MIKKSNNSLSYPRFTGVLNWKVSRAEGSNPFCGTSLWAYPRSNEGKPKAGLGVALNRFWASPNGRKGKPLSTLELTHKFRTGNLSDQSQGGL